MPNYDCNTLRKLNYTPHKKNQSAPHKWSIPVYGFNQQFATPNDDAPILDNHGIKYVQRVVGSFLYYGRAVDNTILTAINEVLAMQAHPTKNSLDKTQMLLDYLATYPNAKV